MTTTSENEVLEYIFKGLKKDGQKMSIFTLNSEIIVAAQKNNHFKQVLNNASLGLPDSIGVIWAGNLLGKKIPGRITGVDVMEKLCQRAAKEGFTVGLIGGKPKVAERTAECLVHKYPGLRVNFAGSEGKIPKTDMLFVAFGFPKQELWIAQNLSKLPVKMAMGVGGAFDFLSGDIPRAPKWLQTLGFEWLFRLIVQPWRLRRQVALLTFIFMVIEERIKTR